MADKRELVLKGLYEAERLRLSELAGADDPQGEYLHPVFGTGCLTNGVMFIGEAPGAQETLQGMPFVGKAGRQLDELLSGASIDRAQVYITNAVKYRPVVRGPKSTKNRTPTRAELLAGTKLLMAEMEQVSPRVIVTLGNSPLFSVLYAHGMAERKVGEAHGQLITLSHGESTCRLFPCYHPASCIYNRTLKPVLAEDMQRLAEYLKTY